MNIGSVTSSFFSPNKLSPVLPPNTVPTKEKIVQNNPQLLSNPIVQLTQQSQAYLLEVTGLSAVDNDPADTANNVAKETIKQTIETTQELNNPEEDPLAIYQEQSEVEALQSRSAEAATTDEARGAVSQYDAYLRAEVLDKIQNENENETEDPLDILA